MERIRPLEWFLAEMIILIGVWFLNDYIATYLSLVFGAICFAILVIALISEWIEPSKVPRSFFVTMALSVLATILASGIYLVINKGQLTWLQ